MKSSNKAWNLTNRPRYGQVLLFTQNGQQQQDNKIYSRNTIDWRENLEIVLLWYFIVGEQSQKTKVQE